jgi:hypothetical protein
MPSMQSQSGDLSDFSEVLNLVRFIVDRYYRYIFTIAEESDMIVTLPNPYTFVRAISVVLYDKGVTMTRGKCYMLQIEDDRKTFTITPVTHYWLTWMGTYIIDIFPVDGESGISYPHGVTNYTSRYVELPGEYEDHWSDVVRDLANKEVEKMALILENFIGLEIPS